MKKRLSVLLLALLLFISIMPLCVNIVTADSGTIVADDNGYFSCNLKVQNPDNSTAYSNNIPLNLAMDWTANNAIFWIEENTSYSIDNNPAALLQSKHFDFEYFNQTVTTQVDSIVNISSLQTGQHKLNITVNGIYNVGNDFLKTFSVSFKPVLFEVRGQTASSLTPTVPEFSWLAPLPLLFSAFFVAVIIRYKNKSKNLRLTNNPLFLVGKNTKF